MHRNSLLLFKKYGSAYFTKDKRVLEIGPDKSPSSFNDQLVDKPHTWHTLDLSDAVYLSQYTYVASDLYKYAIEDNAYDVILSGQVIEHVAAPWTWLTELKRIVKPGGHIVIISPTSWPYHEAPIDCWRIYPEGMKELARLVGLNIVSMHWESLEREQLQGLKHLKFIEGRSPFYISTEAGIRKVNRFNSIIKKIPFLRGATIATEVAHDLITVFRKD